MKDKLIIEYINRITTKDIDDFAKKNGIILKAAELDLILKTIKSKWRTILYGNPIPILNEMKEKMNSINYKKVEELFIHFKNMYSSYL
ncbi:MAG: hypothetical protein ACM3O4_04845 [Ignavibacteriales bacterium]